ncbi:MAG: hypothetical protein H6625_11935 [Bdellovibrionaceae bacterium]|nr:hypothetical protein [Pseudobdellovibrionaceae bacterium]
MKQWHDTNHSLIKDILFMATYRFCVVPLLISISLLLALFGNKKVRQGLKMRWPHKNNHPWFDLPKRQHPIWIHCSSGEFEYAKPLISRIKTQYPKETILVTYFSPTYKKNIERFSGVDMSCPLPWDTPGSIHSFIKHHLPKALLIARTDLWPELLYQMKKRNLPTLMFSATLSKHKNKFLKPLWIWLYQQLSLIYCVSQEDKNNFLKMQVPVVEAIGDTRYDQVQERLKKPKALKSFLTPAQNLGPLIFVAGSTWEEDEKVVLDASLEFIDHKKICLIIAPHEPTAEHLKNLEDLLSSLGLEYLYYSQASTWPPGKVLIVDTLGVLAEVYTSSHLALVGGSFKKSVHSVMEPLAAGAIAFVGPFHRNNREALEFKTHKLNNFPALNVVNEIQDREDLKKCIYKAIEYRSQLEGVQNEIKDLISSKTGASNKIIQWISEVL